MKKYVSKSFISMSKRTKATGISSKVRQEVKERDKWCIFCGRTGHHICHIRPRSSGGLGIKENLVFGCVSCHMMLDQSTKRKVMIQFALNYLDRYYPNFPDEKRYFKK